MIGACKEGAFLMRYFGLYGALLLLIQGLTGCGPATGPTAQNKDGQGQPSHSEKAPDEMHGARLVVAFGDSLYAGYQLGPNEGFAPQLQAALIAAGINAKVHNAGVSGDTTAAGKARLAFVLDNLKRKPDLVVLGLGGNDMLRGIKPEQTKKNLIAMLEELKRREIPLVLTGILASPNMGAAYSKAFNPIFPALAKQFDVPFYPFFLDGVVVDRALMLPDYIHPNAKGVGVVVKGVAPLVVAALQE
jgi:acyl-CoA thioesterase I